MRTRSWTSAACLLGTLLASFGFCVAEELPPPKLLGACNAEQLRTDPYDEWFVSAYEAYVPNSEIAKSLQRSGYEGIEITTFFGTWCGDSRREVPRLFRTLDAWGLPESQRKLVAVDSIPEAYKRSPDGEEQGAEIYRVPTVVVSRNGTEIGRIVEYPVLSLERDLVAILEGQPYSPNYASYPVVQRWLREGLLGDPNVDAAGLAGQVRGKIATEGELAAAARVLLSRGDTPEAVKLFRVNCDLYPESAASRARLASALFAAGDREAATKAAERALALNTDPESVPELLAVLDRARGAGEIEE